MASRVNLGDVLLASGVLTSDQLERALAHRQDSGKHLAPTIVELGLATDEQIVGAVAAREGILFFDLTTAEPDRSAATLIPGELATQHGAIPVGYDGDRLVVALANPSIDSGLDAIAEVTGLEVTPAWTTRRGLAKAIKLVYGASNSSPDDELTDGQRDIERVGQRLGVSHEVPPFDIHDLLETVLRVGASDLHLTVGRPPSLRLQGDLQPLAEYDVLDPGGLQKIIYGMLTQKQRERLENELELDISYSVPGQARFRVNVYIQRGALGAAFRLIPFEIKDLQTLGIPAHVAEFAKMPRGLVVVTGPTGSGKSTTLAALVDLINRTRPVHIMTVEDPIEFLHNHKKAMVNQREVGEDTLGFAQALKHVLRQDPDVILVGEMRDLETIHMAVTAAETGHLVFGTLHTQDAPQTIDRIVDVFPPHQQQQIRVQLAGSLQAVIAQQLLQTSDGRSRIVAAEILKVTPAVRNLIREAKTHQIYSIMQAGGQFGMQTMDASLADLVQRSKVTYETALERAHNADEFARLTTGNTAGSGIQGKARARVVR